MIQMSWMNWTVPRLCGVSPLELSSEQLTCSKRMVSGLCWGASEHLGLPVFSFLFLLLHSAPLSWPPFSLLSVQLKPMGSCTTWPQGPWDGLRGGSKRKPWPKYSPHWLNSSGCCLPAVTAVKTLNGCNYPYTGSVHCWKSGLIITEVV